MVFRIRFHRVRWCRSLSGRHVRMYKATVTSLNDPDTTKIQKKLASMILSIANCATQMGIMLERRKEAKNIMIQKKEAVRNIDKLRCIWLLEGDKNLALKRIMRVAMRELEN